MDWREFGKPKNSSRTWFYWNIGLPKLNGINACRLIRSGVPESKIVFLTQQTEIDVVNAALDAGAHGYVKKSRTQSDLMPSVGTVLEGRQFVSSGLNVPVFDIFRGAANKEAVWEETVRGLSSARERMETIARLRPGQYFVFSPTDHSILAKTTSSKNLGQAKPKIDVA
jgi:DNA-binding NarL/FixJ family response regulator